MEASTRGRWVLLGSVPELSSVRARWGEQRVSGPERPSKELHSDPQARVIV